MNLRCSIARNSGNYSCIAIVAEHMHVLFSDIENITRFAGGFYSDDVGTVGESCKKCPNGSFVQFEKTPGTSKQDCKAYPEGITEFFFFPKQILVFVLFINSLPNYSLSLQLPIISFYKPKNISRFFTKFLKKSHSFIL